ncbi:VOC family metalloprotein YjdN [Escherichia coli]|uniref:VOC family metalloprotein YjdN n=1 Tax=Escherichia coli TaxID=562 RepID=UPI00184356A3|nr:VOC family metalloprotein YjdN [Escherichia coli]EEW5433204.1 VOC family metalloprotein YjdN [Escherichia coli]EFA1462903.1 VOC family metalloprotein YjdN [Escherichia coli]EFM1887931.1 VOC family metalloprotein YjdN [Escherichia coli]HAH1457153.1 hypothetical protein [Escherichia coli]
MPLSPYLSFAGNCADAIAYYQRTLGAELLYKISFGEMPKSAQDSAENCPSGMQFPDTAIAHANVRIAGSDINQNDGITVVVTLHQVDYALRYCERIVALRQGHVFYDGSSQQFDNERFDHLYRSINRIEENAKAA